MLKANLLEVIFVRNRKTQFPRIMNFQQPSNDSGNTSRLSGLVTTIC
ncbi:hypothetical protein BH11BAC5_BH11BAC5_07780 [soil metagenome]